MRSEALSAWKARLQGELEALDAQSQRRTLAEITGVNLCSNDYLGLAANPLLRQSLLLAVERSHRVGGTGSRLLSGQTEEWRALEDHFAEFAGTESALYFTTGFAANTGLLSSLLQKEDIVFSDASNHASLIDGIRLSNARKVIYPHLQLDRLEDALREYAGAPGRKVVVTESVFSMDGDVAPLQEIVDLTEKHGAALIVDEAHATGVFGPGGRGLVASLGLCERVLAVIHTCGKALACAGAFACGPSVLKDHLVNRARSFIFSTALPPYFAVQIRSALDLATGMNRERELLLLRAARLREALRAEGFDAANSASQIVPVVLGGNKATLDAAEHLQREGFAVRGIRPPTVPPGGSRLRLSLTADISQDDLHRLAASLCAWRSRQTAFAAVRHA